MSLYKVLPIASVNEHTFKLVVQKDISKCRTSLDGNFIIVKVPSNIKSEDDIEDMDLKGEYNRLKSFITHKEALELMATPEWSMPDDLAIETRSTRWASIKEEQTARKEVIKDTIVVSWFTKFLRWLKSLVAKVD